jgi:xylan 1,4-beta-xylosidase
LDGQGIPSNETPSPSSHIATESVPSTGEEGVRREANTHCRYDFNEPRLPIDFQWLRTPWPEEIFSLSARPGYLRLHGRETIGSLFRQSLVARRQQSHCFSADTLVEFEPEHFQQLAGLVCYYNSAKFHYLYISHDESVGKHLRVMSCLPDSPQTDAFTPPIALPSGKRVHLRVDVDYERLHFAYRLDGVDEDWRWLPQQFDASILADEATMPGFPNFTGAFVGMACQDLAGTAAPADFDFFEYCERDYRANPFSAALG